VLRGDASKMGVGNGERIPGLASTRSR